MIGQAYRNAQILSLDIVIGALILLRFFCAQLSVEVEWEVYALLAGTIWLIYTTDHLRDAEKASHSSRERYLFHQKHRKILIGIALIVLIVMIPLVLFVPIIITLAGGILALLSILYLLIQHKLSTIFSKEIYVALVYTIGVLMVPFLLSQQFRFDLFVSLFLLALVNLLIYSWYERADDQLDGFSSIATKMSKSTLEKIIVILFPLVLEWLFSIYQCFQSSF